MRMRVCCLAMIVISLPIHVYSARMPAHRRILHAGIPSIGVSSVRVLNTYTGVYYTCFELSATQHKHARLFSHCSHTLSAVRTWSQCAEGDKYKVRDFSQLLDEYGTPDNWQLYEDEFESNKGKWEVPKVRKTRIRACARTYKHVHVRIRVAAVRSRCKSAYM